MSKTNVSVIVEYTQIYNVLVSTVVILEFQKAKLVEKRISIFFTISLRMSKVSASVFIVLFLLREWMLVV